MPRFIVINRGCSAATDGSLALPKRPTRNKDLISWSVPVFQPHESMAPFPALQRVSAREERS